MPPNEIPMDIHVVTNFIHNIATSKVVKNECRVVGSSDPMCHSLAGVLRSCSGSILRVLQLGSSYCTQKRNEKRAGLAKLKLGFANQVGSK